MFDFFLSDKVDHCIQNFPWVKGADAEIMWFLVTKRYDSQKTESYWKCQWIVSESKQNKAIDKNVKV